jgi:hypothetical protein
MQDTRIINRQETYVSGSRDDFMDSISVSSFRFGEPFRSR